MNMLRIECKIFIWKKLSAYGRIEKIMLRGICMSYTFEEIMQFHPDNEDVYEEIKKLLIGKKLVPFVGAGLTKFAYYS